MTRQQLEPLAATRPLRVAAKSSGNRGSGETALRGPGAPLGAAVRADLEPRFGHDLSQVRVHSGSAAATSAHALGASAFTIGHEIGFAAGRYDPASAAGRELLAHELAHVVQQTGSGARGTAGDAALEAEADRAAADVMRGNEAPALTAAETGVQRRVEMRRPGPREAQGWPRLPELIDRLNAISTALIFHVESGGTLTYTENPYGTETDFDRKMKNFIDNIAVIPMRLTDRQGSMRDGNSGPFNLLVQADSWTTGYVDIDDLLASDDVALQSTLIHFMTERARTSNYARRMGTNTFSEREFNRVHAAGIDAEVLFMQDFFGDKTIRHHRGRPGNVVVQFTNSRGDMIRMHMAIGGRGEQRGLHAMTISVRLADGTIITADEYRALLARAGAAAVSAQGAAARGSPVVGPPP